MTGDNFDKEAAAVTHRWAASLRAMGYLHAAVELDDAAGRLDPDGFGTLDGCSDPNGDCAEQTHVA